MACRREDDLRRIDFLRRLASKAPQISQQRAAWLSVDMAKRTSEMRSDDVAYIVTKALVFALAARFQGGPDFQLVLDQVVTEAGSDRFASDIVHSSVSRTELADEVTSWDSFDADQIKKDLWSKNAPTSPDTCERGISTSPR